MLAADDTCERLLESDEIWFPDGQPICAAHDDIVGELVEVSLEDRESGAAYVIRTMTGIDGRVSVEYASPEDDT